MALLFVLVSQIQIHVTNAYAGSLARSNVFVRLAHYHPARGLAGVQCRDRPAADAARHLRHAGGGAQRLRDRRDRMAGGAGGRPGRAQAARHQPAPRGIPPAYLHAFNPVGCGAMLAASLAGLGAYAGLFGATARAYAAFTALAASFCCAVAIAYATGGATTSRATTAASARTAPTSRSRCCVCERDYEAPDMAHCPFYGGPICSLCCGTDNHCHDACKAARRRPARAHHGHYGERAFTGRGTLQRALPDGGRGHGRAVPAGTAPDGRRRRLVRDTIRRTAAARLRGDLALAGLRRTVDRAVARKPRAGAGGTAGVAAPSRIGAQAPRRVGEDGLARRPGRRRRA